jgi:hypothetical protein
MRGIILILALAGAGVAVLALRSESRPPPPRGDATAPGFAVVELFTSEGCSSCPPADANLTRLLSAAGARPVLGLSWHVDYWDRLGWKDPFSSEAATQRQNAYAHAWGTRRLYTPQMVVNGRDAFVGSSEAQADAAVAAALKRPATVGLSARAEAAGAGAWRVTWAAEGAPTGCVVLVALTQGGRSVAVPRGENAGRTLRHEGVVRAFAQAPVGSGEGELTLTAPVDARGPEVALVAMVQHQATRAILAATRVTR